jgi:hypothetical protein
MGRVGCYTTHVKKWKQLRKKKKKKVMMISMCIFNGSFLTQYHILTLPYGGGIMLCNDK